MSDDDDYERFHRKQKKRGASGNISPSSASKQKKSKKAAAKKSADTKPATKKKAANRKVQSEKVSLASMSQTKSTPTPKKKKKKAGVNTPKVSTPKSPMKKRTSKTRPKTATAAKGRSKLKRAHTVADTDMNLNGLFDDDVKSFDIGDMSKYALDAKKRAEILEKKNRTYGGFKLRINYRYRLEDNRIGQCRFIGIPLFAKNSEQWVGMVIEHNGEGEHDGTVQNKSYFRCRDGKGAFVRPYQIIEDLGINTIELTKEQIKGSPEIHEIMKNMHKKPKGNTKNAQSSEKTKVNKPLAKTKPKRAALKQRSKTESNLETSGWKPPDYMNDIDQDHGYDFLASKPFYSKQHLLKNPYKNGPVSVTAFNRKNHY